MKVAVSYLDSPEGVEKTVRKIALSEADFIHVDLMDGKFVARKNLDLDTDFSYFGGLEKPLDVHLMVEDPMLYLDQILALHPARITIHVEAKEVKKALEKIQEAGIEAGLSIKPDSSLTLLDPFYSLIDAILVLSVYPGAGGQSFLMPMVSRLQVLKKIQETFSYELSVDGGINETTILLVKPYVDMVISGSFVWKKEDYTKQIRILKGEEAKETHLSF